MSTPPSIQTARSNSNLIPTNQLTSTKEIARFIKSIKAEEIEVIAKRIIVLIMDRLNIGIEYGYAQNMDPIASDVAQAIGEKLTDSEMGHLEIDYVETLEKETEARTENGSLLVPVVRKFIPDSPMFNALLDPLKEKISGAFSTANSSFIIDLFAENNLGILDTISDNSVKLDLIKAKQNNKIYDKVSPTLQMQLSLIKNQIFDLLLFSNTTPLSYAMGTVKELEKQMELSFA